MPNIQPEPQRSPRLPSLELAPLYLFAFGCFLGAALGNGALLLMLVAFISLAWRSGHTLWRDPLAKLGVFFIGYHFVRAYLSLDTLPSAESPMHDTLLDGYYEALVGWPLLWLFLVSGWLLSAAPHHARPLLALASAGLILESAASVEWSQLMTALTQNEHRLDFGMTVNGIGLLAAVGLFGTVALGAPLFRPIRHGGTWTWVLRAAMVLLGMGFLAMLVASQSRTAWTATLAAVLATVAWLVARRISRLRGRPRRMILEATTVTVLLAAALAALLQTKVVQERIAFTVQQESAVVTAVLQGRLDEVPNSSVGNRVYMYRQGIERFWERPWLGWGSGTAITRHYGEEDGYPFLTQFSDLHNGFLIVLVRFGLVGAVPFLLAGGILTWRVVKTAWTGDGTQRQLALFCTGAMFIAAVASTMNFRWIHLDFGFFWILVGGVAYAVSLPEQYRPATRNP